jgi:hypothetical protein
LRSPSAGQSELQFETKKPFEAIHPTRPSFTKRVPSAHGGQFG